MTNEEQILKEIREIKQDITELKIMQATHGERGDNFTTIVKRLPCAVNGENIRSLQVHRNIQWVIISSILLGIISGALWIIRSGIS